MSELNFPQSPVVGQEYIFNTLTYIYDGVKWVTKSAGYDPIQDVYDLLNSDEGAAFIGAVGYSDVQAALDAPKEFAGNIEQPAAWADVPAHSNPQLSEALNSQAKGLVARTEQLKADIAALRTGVTALAGTVSPIGSWADVPAHSDPVMQPSLDAQAVALAARTELLRTTEGAKTIGTKDGRNVQAVLDTIPSVESATTLVSTLIDAHNHTVSAHPELAGFITNEANRAQAAADAASTSGQVFSSTANGIAGTTDGKYFSVVSPIAEGYLDLYKNSVGVAVYQKTYPSSALVKKLDDGYNKLTGNTGFSMDGTDGPNTIEVPKDEKKALVIGTYDDEMLIFDTVAKKTVLKDSDLVTATVSKIFRASDVNEPDSEHTEELISSHFAKVISDNVHSLTYDTVNGELISTFKLIDKSQNAWSVFENTLPRMVTGIPPEYAFNLRKFQGIPTIAKTGNRFWVAWWADVNQAAEALGNFLVIGYSDDYCKTVKESHVLRFDDMNHHLLDPMLWTNPETGELWFFWSSCSNGQKNDGLMGCWCSILDYPEAEAGFSWSLPYKYRNAGDPRRPIRIAGKWVQCIDLYSADAAHPPIYPDTAGCTFVEFDPRNKTTTNIGRNSPNYNGKYAGFFESEVVQLRDGRLMSVTRSYSNSVEATRSFSTDGGKTWSAQETYTALGDTTSSRMWLGRLPSGRLMIVYNNYKTRTNMVVKLSEDDGETWPYSVVLEGPNSPQNTSYPIAAIDGDYIYVCYDYGRVVANEIRVTIVKESEIIAGIATPQINIVSGPTIA